MQNTVLHIQGMSCNACVKSIENTLSTTNGVIHATVNLPDASVQIDFNPAQTNIQTLIQVIEDAGFEAEAQAA
ncbi:MAG: cation transporter [Alysiella sp.]|uniref:heavy-metal-associated domain-containing protein n=1 Tax=Alysiella sp. TaxID=1872483 RepID=UPI0026DBCC00|nr:cation transporter [Alysiella sp.]MDO4434466.1 cation transporter [Alysiella sp.]